MGYALEVKNLYKKIKKKEILKDISFNVNYGETLGFIGANGAGKTSTIKCVANLWHPCGGEISICGKNIRTNFEDAMQDGGFLIESPRLYDDLSPLEFLTYISSFYKKEISIKDIEEIISDVNLNENKNKKLKTFSSGMYQRICLAAVLLRKPRLVVLDEPTSALDPKSIIDFRDILINFKQKYNIAVFISSHNLREIEKLCDRVIIIDKGILLSVKEMNRINLNKIYKIEFENEKIAEKAFKLSNEKAKRNRCAIEITCEPPFFQKFIADCLKNNLTAVNINIENTLENDFMEILKVEKK